MNSKKIGVIVSAIIVLLFAVFSGALYFSLKHPSINFVSIISGLSSFFVAILTALYVYTTSKQIEVANEQLEEMRQERAMQEQPLLTLVDDKFQIERPRFFYTPPEDEYCFLSRYKFSGNIYNCSSYPAIAADISAEILIPKDEEICILETISRRLNVIRPNEKASFFLSFSDDNATQLFESLRNARTDLLPRVRITILYRNLCGGYFESKKYEYIAPLDDDVETLILWHSRIHSAYIEEKDHISKLQQMSHNAAWKADFDSIKDVFNNSLGDRQNIKLKCIEIPEKFSLNNLSKQEFDETTKNHHFPHYVHRTNVCERKIPNKNKMSL